MKNLRKRSRISQRNFRLRKDKRIIFTEMKQELVKNSSTNKHTYTYRDEFSNMFIPQTLSFWEKSKSNMLSTKLHFDSCNRRAKKRINSLCLFLRSSHLVSICMLYYTCFYLHAFSPIYILAKSPGTLLKIKGKLT